MKSFQKILVHVDTETGHLEAWERGLQLAASAGGSITLIDVIEELPASLRNPAHGYPSLVDTLKADKQEELIRLSAEAREEGVDVRVQIAYGKPFLEISRAVLKDRYDVVLETIERGIFNLHGGTAGRLMRKCPCPVWAVQPERGPAVRRILAAVDPSSEYDEAGVDRSILDTALAVAELDQAELHVVHASAGRVVEQPAFSRYAGDLDTFARQRLEKLLAPYGESISNGRIHLAAGEPARVILDVAKEVDADLLVMGTVVRTGFQGILMGNTAERVLSDIRCSLLALKPASFVSPITAE